MTVPFPRIVTALKNGDEWCFVGGVRTPEREGFAVFSRPVAMFYPLRIVVPASKRARFAALEPLSLRSLLSEHRALRTSVLRDAPSRQRSMPCFGNTRWADLCPLHRGVSHAVERPARLPGRFLQHHGYHIRQIARADDVVGLPFAESPEPVFARVMCAGTPGAVPWWRASTRF